MRTTDQRFIRGHLPDLEESSIPSWETWQLSDGHDRITESLCVMSDHSCTHTQLCYFGKSELKTLLILPLPFALFQVWMSIVLSYIHPTIWKTLLKWKMCKTKHRDGQWFRIMNVDTSENFPVHGMRRRPSEEFAEQRFLQDKVWVTSSRWTTQKIRWLWLNRLCNLWYVLRFERFALKRLFHPKSHAKEVFHPKSHAKEVFHPKSHAKEGQLSWKVIL